MRNVQTYCLTYWREALMSLSFAFIASVIAAPLWL